MSVIRRALLSRNFLDYTKIILPCSRTLNTFEEDKNILRSASSDVDVPNITIPELVYPRLEKFHKYTATVSTSSVFYD
ncbi:hypothetical protein JTB14_029160 [Gonioctena quinquepunctata]|nr:hypothetical protein JTB14_029160 [Gonioctena quinquepunctata]